MEHLPSPTKEQGESASKQYISYTAETRRDITSFSLAIIASTWVLFDKGIICSTILIKTTFLLSVLSIASGLLSKVFGSDHLKKFMENFPELSYDYRSTHSGIWAYRFSWLARILIAFSLISFIITVFS